MIEIFDDKKGWTIRKGMFRNGCYVDRLNKRDLNIIYNRIGKILGKVDWKKEMEKDKKLFTQRLVPGMTAKVVKGKYLLTKYKKYGNKKSN